MDLFDDTVIERVSQAEEKQETAQLFKLPIDPYVWHVRRTARILERREGRKRDHFWRTEISRLVAKSISEKLPQIEIKERVARFELDVTVELERAEWFTWKYNQQEKALSENRNRA